VPVPACDGDAEAADAAGSRIPVIPRILRGLHQLVDDVPGRGAVGVAHAEVDDVLAPGPRLDLEVGDLGQDVRGQPLDPVEIVHPGDPSETVAECFSPGVAERTSMLARADFDFPTTGR